MNTFKDGQKVRHPKYGGINEGSDYKYKKYDSVSCYHNISKNPPKFD